jgi:hypothetical protein
MKYIFSFLLACFLISFAHAQEKKMDKMNSKMGMKHKMKDCVMMEDGKMMVMKGGENMAMDQDMTMTNGTMVMTDGTVKMKSGKTTKLKNGDCVMMNGMVTRSKMSGHKSKMKSKA